MGLLYKGWATTIDLTTPYSHMFIILLQNVAIFEGVTCETCPVGD
jgi:hypothetical protein